MPNSSKFNSILPSLGMTTKMELGRIELSLSGWMDGYPIKVLNIGVLLNCGFIIVFDFNFPNL